MAKTGNKPGEPACQLKLDPSDKLPLKFTIGAQTNFDLKVTNTTKDRQTFKIRCTDNDLFRVRPPLGFLKPDETIPIKIIVNNPKAAPPNDKHFFAFYHMKCADEKKTARQAWPADAKPEGVARLPVTFEAEAAKPGSGEKKPEEKKPEEKKEEPKKEEAKKEEEKKPEEKKEEKKEEPKKEEEKKPEEKKEESKKEEPKKEEEKK